MPSFLAADQRWDRNSASPDAIVPGSIGADHPHQYREAKQVNLAPDTATVFQIKAGTDGNDFFQHPRGQGVVGKAPDNTGSQRGNGPQPGQGGVDIVAHRGKWPDAGTESLVRQCKQHDAAYEHGQGLNPEQLVAVHSADCQGGYGAAAPQGHGPLQPTRATQSQVGGNSRGCWPTRQRLQLSCLCRCNSSLGCTNR